MLKKIFILFIFILFISQPVSAEQGFFSGIFDTFKSLFTQETSPQDDLNKLHNNLIISKQLLNQHKIEELGQSLHLQTELIEEIKQDLNSLNEENLDQELRNIIKIKKEILTYNSNVKDFHIDIEINLLKDLSKTDQDRINKLILELEKESNELTFNIENKQEKTITKMRAYGKDQESVNLLLMAIEKEQKLNIWKQQELNKSIQRISRLVEYKTQNDKSLQDIENLSQFEEFSKIYELSEAMRKQLLNISPDNIKRKVQQIKQETEKDNSLMILEQLESNT